MAIRRLRLQMRSYAAILQKAAILPQVGERRTVSKLGASAAAEDERIRTEVGTKTGPRYGHRSPEAY